MLAISTLQDWPADISVKFFFEWTELALLICELYYRFPDNTDGSFYYLWWVVG